MVEHQYNSAEVSTEETSEKREVPVRPASVKKTSGGAGVEINKKLMKMVEDQYNHDKGDNVVLENDGEDKETNGEKVKSHKSKKHKKKKLKAEKKLKKKKKKAAKKKEKEKSESKDDQGDQQKMMKPMTKEEWEAQKNGLTRSNSKDYYDENKQKHDSDYKWVLSQSPPPPHIRAAYKTFKKPQNLPY